MGVEEAQRRPEPAEEEEEEEEEEGVEEEAAGEGDGLALVIPGMMKEGSPIYEKERERKKEKKREKKREKERRRGGKKKGTETYGIFFLDSKFFHPFFSDPNNFSPAPHPIKMWSWYAVLDPIEESVNSVGVRL